MKPATPKTELQSIQSPKAVFGSFLMCPPSPFGRRIFLWLTMLIAPCIANLSVLRCDGADITQLNNEALAAWSWRNPQLPPITLNDVIFVSGEFLTVGQFGTIAKSTNLVNWTVGKSGAFSNLNSVAFGGGQYVAVGDAGTVVRSTNGVVWVAGNPGVTIDLPAVAYGNGRFVCVGTNGTIITSVDATAWSAATSPVVETLSDVAFGGGAFVAVGEFGTVLTSADGQTWNVQSAGTTTWLRNVQYMGGKFIVIIDASTLLTSNNGISWTQKSVVGPATVFLSGSPIVAATRGIGVLMYSPDGNSWYHADAGLNFGLINAVTAGNGKYCGVGAEGRLVISHDGKDWGEPFAGSGNYLYAVTFGSGKFVAVGDVNTRLVSPDGYEWSGSVGYELKILEAVAYGNGKFVAVGNGNQAYVSSDGTTWTTNTLLGGYRAITYGNNYFVAVGDSGSARSTNGINWEKQSLGHSLNALVAYGNGVYVTAAFPDPFGGQLILSSPDGMNWTTNYSLPTGYLQAVTFGEGIFVAVGVDGLNQSMILTSPDGASWTDTSTGGPYSLKSVAYGNQLFVAVGQLTGNGGGSTILTSPDGASWTPRDPDVLKQSVNTLLGVCYGGGKFLAVGYSDQEVGIVSSTDGMNWNRSAPFRRELHAIAGGQGKVVVAGKLGKLLVKDAEESFQQRNTGYTNDLNGLCIGSNTYVAVGSAGMLITSTDLTNWAQRNSRTTSDLKGIAFGDGKFVAVGGTQFRLSTNATSWSILSDGTGVSYSAIAYGKDRFVAVGGAGTAAKARSSTNGVDWITSNPPWEVLYSITYGNGVFVAGGKVFSPGAYVAAFAVSTNGNQWQGVSLPSFGTIDSSIHAIAFGAGRFVAISYDGFVLTSTNGLTWDRLPRFMNRHMYAAAYLNSSFFFGGELGAAIQSDYLVDELNPSLTIARSGSGAIINWPYTSSGFLLEFSSDLSNPNGWQPINTGGQKNLILPAISEKGFYRLRHP